MVGYHQKIATWIVSQIEEWEIKGQRKKSEGKIAKVVMEEWREELLRDIAIGVGMYRCIGFGIGSIGAFLGYRYR